MYMCTLIFYVCHLNTLLFKMFLFRLKISWSAAVYDWPYVSRFMLTTGKLCVVNTNVRDCEFVKHRELISTCTCKLYDFMRYIWQLEFWCNLMKICNYITLAWWNEYKRCNLCLCFLCLQMTFGTIQFSLRVNLW